MPFHGSATADAELHNPRGVDAVPLDLTDDSATAYRIRRDDGATYPNILGVTTATGAVALTIGNTTDNPTVTINAGSTVINAPQSTSNALLIQRGSGDPILSIDTAATSSPHAIRVREASLGLDEIPSEPTAAADRVQLYAYDNAGTTELRARTTAGTVNLLASAGSASGTSNVSWTVNDDAAAASAENSFVRLLGGDGVAAPNNDLIRTTLTQVATSERLTLFTDRSRNGGAYVARPTVLEFQVGNGSQEHPAIIFPSSIVISSQPISATAVYSIQIGAAPTIPAGGAAQFVSIGHATEVYNYSVAIGYNAAAKDEYQVVIGYLASTGYSTSDHAIAIGRQTSATGADSIALGYLAATAGTESIALGRSATASHANCLALGRGATTSAANQLVLGSASYATTDLYLGRGVTSATSGTTSIYATQGTGTNVAGHALVMSGGAATGNAIPGSVTMRVAARGTTGTTLQTYFDGAALAHSSAATTANVGNGLVHHLRRSHNLTSAGNFSWHVRDSKSDASTFTLWTVDLSTFESGAFIAAGTVLVWCRVVGSGALAGTRYSGTYSLRARVEVDGSTLTLIDTGTSQHEGTHLEDRSAWDATFDVSGTAIRLRCTGDTDFAVGWHADVWLSYTPDGV